MPINIYKLRKLDTHIFPNYFDILLKLICNRKQSIKGDYLLIWKIYYQDVQNGKSRTNKMFNMSSKMKMHVFKLIAYKQNIYMPVSKCVVQSLQKRSFILKEEKQIRE